VGVWMQVADPRASGHSRRRRAGVAAIRHQAAARD
jgi:hypothetical protein